MNVSKNLPLIIFYSDAENALTVKHNKYTDFANVVKQSFPAFHKAHDR